MATTSNKERPVHHEDAILERYDDRVREADEAIFREFDGKHTFYSAWWKCVRRYHGDHYDKVCKEGIEYATVNRDLSVVESKVSGELQQSPRVKLQPVETDGFRVYCFTREAILKNKKLMQSVEFESTGGVGESELMGLQWISEEERDELLQLANQVEVNGVVQSEQPVYDQSDFIAVDDVLVTEVVQDEFNRQFNQACGEEKYEQVSRNRIIQGHQVWVFEWKEREQKWEIHVPDIRMVRIDPMATSPENARYLIWDQVLDAAIAKQRWPKFKQEIEDAEQTGVINENFRRMTDTAQRGLTLRETDPAHYWDRVGSLSGRFDEVNLKRPVVVVSVMWEREDFPISLDEARDQLLVTQVDYTVEQGIEDGLVRRMMVNQPFDEVMMVQPEPQEVFFIPETEESTDPSADNWPVPESQWVLTDDDGDPTDEVCTPPDEKGKGASANWPVREHWRQSKLLPQIQKVLDTRRCPYLRPPIGWQVHLPIINTPFGMGEPLRTESITEQRNALATAIWNHFRYYTYPSQVVPRSLYDTWQESGQKMYLHPGKVDVVDDDTFQQMMQTGFKFAVDSPKLDGEMVQWYAMLGQDHDETSQHGDVMQGRSHASDSGTKVDTLLNQAMAPVALTARHAERDLERMAELWTDGMFTRGWLKLRTLLSRTSKYPPGVYRAVSKWGREMRWTFTAEIASGRGVTRARERELALLEYREGLTSAESYHQKSGKSDPKREVERVIEEQIDVEKKKAEAMRELQNEVAPQDMAVQQGQPMPVAQPQPAM